MSDSSEQSQTIQNSLRFIYEGTATATGPAFFQALVRATAHAMNVKWAFVSEFAGSHERVRTLAYWAGSAFKNNVEYQLDGTVCERVLQGEMSYYPCDVAPRFPREPALQELGVESYLATPITTQAGDVLGHLAVFDVKPMMFSDRELEVFKIFGARAGAELERSQAIAALQQSETRLATILDSAQDAVITLKEGQRIELFNKAAERIFRSPAEQVIGKPFDRFLSHQLRQVLSCYVDNNSSQGQKVWAPEGITALRADGEEFPIEVTISPLHVGNERLLTLILRDVNEREYAKQEIRRLQDVNLMLKEDLSREHRFMQIIGNSPAMRTVFDQIKVVAPTDASVLLIGDTGTGKELIASALHAASGRQDGLLVSVNCAALPSELIESELFGHEKGAFTGATEQRKGRFELADQGTLFLDEVGELTAQAQAKLLRVLQEQSFERVGGTRTLRVNVRVVAATNRDLAEMAAKGTFRSDLYYRLNVFPIMVPYLRDRKEDIPLLAHHFLERMARKLGKPLRGIEPAAVAQLESYSWPGNVRELQNVMERAAIVAQGELVSLSDMLFPQLATPAATASRDTSLAVVQKAHIIEVLEKSRWKIEGRDGAAAALGLKPSTLRYRMQKLGIKKTG